MYAYDICLCMSVRVSLSARVGLGVIASVTTRVSLRVGVSASVS